jgi:hypothetical protein
VFEYLQIVFRAIAALLGAWRIINGTHESDESIWNDPVEITILHFFIVFILFIVKITELVPPVADGYL